MNVELGLRTYLLAMASNPDTNLINVNSCCSKQIINSTGKRQKCFHLIFTLIGFLGIHLHMEECELIVLFSQDEENCV